MKNKKHINDKTNIDNVVVETLENKSIDVDKYEDNSSSDIKKQAELNKSLWIKFKDVHKTPKPENIKTKEEKILEILKCKYNILYFLQNYAKITLQGASNGALIMLNDHLKTVALLYQASVRHIFQTSRQSSKTTIEKIADCWYLNFWSNTKLLFFNKVIDDNKKNLRNVKIYLQLLPQWMRSYDPKRDVNNVESLETGIKSLVRLMKIDRENPDSTARGETAAISIDECGFLKNIHIAYAPMSFAYITYSKILRNTYAPAPFSIVSTPADPKLPEGEFFKNLWESAYEVTYDEIKDMLPYEIYDYISKKSPNLTAKVYQKWYEFPGRCEPELYDPKNENNIIHLLENPSVDLEVLEEYSKSATAYLKEVRSICKTYTQLRREVYCEFLSVAGNSIFEEAFLENIKIQNPNHVIKIPDIISGNLNIYENIHERNDQDFYLIGIDPAASSKGDFCAITVFNMRTNSVAATAKLKVGKVNKIINVIKLIYSYFRNCVLIPERNNFGLAVIESILEDIELSRKLFYYYKDNKKLYRMTDQMKLDSRIYGIQTDKVSRPNMLQCLKNFVEMNPDNLNSQDLILELNYITEKPDGRIEASSNNHDDLVLSLSFILYILEYKMKDLERFIPLDKRYLKTMSYVISANKHIDSFNANKNIMDKIETNTLTKSDVIKQFMNGDPRLSETFLNNGVFNTDMFMEMNKMNINTFNTNNSNNSSIFTEENNISTNNMIRQFSEWNSKKN